MAKKGWGKLVALAAVSGAVAAGVSYVLQYKTYHKELEKDFREFEEDEDSEANEASAEDSSFEAAKVNRNYISLTSSKDEFKVAAKDMAQATKNVLRDAGSLFSDTAHEAVSAAVDTAHIALNSMKAKKEEWKEDHEKDEEPAEELMEDEGFLDDDYVDDDDLYDYERLDSEPVYAEKEASRADEEPSLEEDADETDDVISVEITADEEEEGTILAEDEKPLI